ncbi:MAG: NAD-dependent epimerase/dehydratase family protein [Candidatus Helarchaeota archaeon]
MKKGNVLVTGGAGFIGSHVVDYLVDKYNVIVLDDLSGGFIENINEKAIFIKGSIEDYDLILKLFEKYNFDYVFHLAAYAAEGLSHFIKRFNYRNNLIGSINLINASIIYDVKCFIFTSSIAVYGENQLPMTEEMIPQPEDSYGIAKLAVEEELKASHKMFGLNYIIFRPHNVYGPRQNIGDKYRNVIGIFMNQIMQDFPLTVFGDGEQTRAFSYIDDVAPIIAESIENTKAYNEVFNIGADKPYSINELIRIISEVTGIEPKVKYLPKRNEVQHAFSSHQKIQKFFNLKEPVDIYVGIKKMWTWVEKTGIRKSKNFEDIEIVKNLPEVWRENKN